MSLLGRLLSEAVADQSAREAIKACPAGHIRMGGVAGGRNMDRTDEFELAVAAAAGTRVIDSESDAADAWDSITGRDWRHRSGRLAAYTNRAAGDLVAALRGVGDYMDWCHSSGGPVALWFKEAMAYEGWSPMEIL